MKIAKNTVVSVNYKLSDAQNNLIEEAKALYKGTPATSLMFFSSRTYIPATRLPARANGGRLHSSGVGGGVRPSDTGAAQAPERPEI